MVLSLIRFLLRMLRMDNACNSGNKTKTNMDFALSIEKWMMNVILLTLKNESKNHRAK